MKASRELDTMWERLSSAAAPSSVDIALWVGPVLRMTSTAIDAAFARSWITADDMWAIRRQRIAESASTLAGRRLVRRMIAATHAGRSPADVRIAMRCRVCGGTDHGPARVTSPAPAIRHLSSASTDRQLVVALATCPIGVDIESDARVADVSADDIARALPSWPLVQRACTPRSSVIELWTALEALGKATNHGLVAPEPAIEQAITSHQLSWFARGSDHTICAAVRAAAPTFEIVDLQSEPTSCESDSTDPTTG